MEVTRRLAKWLNVREDERGLVVLLISYSFFMGGALAVFYTIVVSSFLVHFKNTVLPEAYIAGGILVYAIGILLTRLQRRFSDRSLGEGSLIMLTVSIFVLVVVYHFTENKWVFFALFIWNRFFVLVNGVTFWAVVSRLFNTQQTKRLSGLINTGDVVSSVIAYLSMPLVIKFVSQEVLLVFVVVLLVACDVVIRRIYARYMPVQGREVAQSVYVMSTEPDEKHRGLRKFLIPEGIDRSYYQYIFMLALLPVFGLFYVEYMFFTESRAIFPDRQALASFLAVFFGICAVLEFLIKTFLYNRLLTRYGMKMGIIILPVGLAFSYLMALAYGVTYGTSAIFFACIGLARFFMSAVRKAISEPTYQVLYQPLPPKLRFSIQGRIEGRAKSVGGLLAGVILFTLYRMSVVDEIFLSVVFLAVAGLWIVLAIFGQRAYKKVVNDRHFDAADRQPKRTRKQKLPEGALSYDECVSAMRSTDAALRKRAAEGLGISKRFVSYKHLIPLLQDIDPQVREAAIAASGELKRPELWPYLFEQLNEDRYYALATDALILSDAPVIKQVEKIFLSGSDSKLSQLKLLEIVEGIGGPTAVRFLRKQITNPNRFIREKATRGLRNLEYKTNSTELPHFLQEFEEYLNTNVWIAAARQDLASNYMPEDQVMVVLAREQRQIILKAFTVLEIIYGNRFGVITLFYGERKEEIRDYLIEIVDLMLPEDLKTKVLPFLESLSEEEMLIRYQNIFPQHRLSVEERIKDIVNKDHARISQWTKAVAIKELKHFDSDSVTPILVSNAVSSSKVVSEAAFYVLRIVNPERFTSLFKIFRERKDQFHISIIEPLEWLNSEEDLLICKLRRLRAISAFQYLSNDNLQRVLLRSEYFTMEDGDIKDLRKFIADRDVSLIVTHGKLQFSGRVIVEGQQLWNAATNKKEGIVMIPTALEDTEFYITENYILQDLGIATVIPAQPTAEIAHSALD
jgi:ATP:ADP antiporter, AAA family